MGCLSIYFPRLFPSKNSILPGFIIETINLTYRFQQYIFLVNLFFEGDKKEEEQEAKTCQKSLKRGEGMPEKIDARGLSCPQPVILTHKKVKEMGKGIVEVLVDTDTARENIIRLAEQTGWNVEVNKSGDNYCLVLQKD